MPRGTCQRMVPVYVSTAVRTLQGGAMHGSPVGDNSGSRLISNGVPCCDETSARIRPDCAARSHRQVRVAWNQVDLHG